MGKLIATHDLALAALRADREEDRGSTMEMMTRAMSPDEQLDMLFAVLAELNGSPELVMLSRAEKRDLARQRAKGDGR